MNICRIIDSEEAKMHMDDIVGAIEHLSNENKRLYEENKKLKSEQYKDEELKRLSEKNKELKEQIFSMRIENEFVLSENEIKKVENWRKEHNKRKHPSGNFGAIGGELTYLFVPTSIGTIGKIVCCCGEEFIFRNME